jgi:hypothetical protein
MRPVIILAVLLAASVLVAGELGRRLFKQQAEHRVQIATLEEALEASSRARKRAEAALVLAARRNAATARERASTGASLAAAAASAPDWADQPVPEEVRRAIE